MQRSVFLLISGLVMAILPALGSAADEAALQATVWTLDRLDEVAGQKATILGRPRLIETPQGKAVQFDGKGDAIILDTNPLAGLAEFTAEVTFQPLADGPQAQRFLHFQETGSENRLLFEIRVIEGKRWFLDTFIKSGEGNHTLYAEKSPHPIGPWYHAAVVMDGKTMRHYVNGIEELSTPIGYKPQGGGQTSIGVRINKVSWYQGAVRNVRITPRPLSPSEFMKP